MKIVSAQFFSESSWSWSKNISHVTSKLLYNDKRSQWMLGSSSSNSYYVSCAVSSALLFLGCGTLGEVTLGGCPSVLSHLGVSVITWPISSSLNHRKEARDGDGLKQFISILLSGISSEWERHNRRRRDRLDYLHGSYVSVEDRTQVFCKCVLGWVQRPSVHQESGVGFS